MNGVAADLKRIATSSGYYAVGELLNRGLAFVLLPVYTRFLDPGEYGALELLNSFSGVLFVFLLLGLPSAVTKCFHRDCETPRQQATVLPTALLLDLPVLVVFAGLFFVFAEPLGVLFVDRAGTGSWVRLVVANAVVASLMAIVLASFRAREKAVTFVALNLTQFVPAMLLNIVLVVGFDLGVRGVLWGNLISGVVALPVGLWVARRGTIFRLDPSLVRPLLGFGLLLVPVMISGWIVNLSDRYVLRVYQDLEQIAVYGVGYKIGAILNIVVVWPFQLAWPAVSFSISHREGHRDSYARTLTYLSVILVGTSLGLCLLSRAGLTYLLGEHYSGAYRIVPWVALAYLLNGIQYSVAPGIHITKKTKYLPVFSAVGAVLNLGLNFLVVPRYGIMGAAWTTTFTFLFLAGATFVLSQRVYAVRYEYAKLAKIAAAGGLTYAAAVGLEPAGAALGMAWHSLWAIAGFPAILWLTGFLDPREKEALGKLRRRLFGGERGT